MSEWKEFKLKDIVKFQSGGTPSKSKDEYWGGEIPWISAVSMDGYEYFDSNLKVTEEGLLNGTRLAPKDSLLLLVRGSILHQKIQVGIAKREVSFNQDVKCLIVDKDLIDPWYLLFWFKANEKELLGKVESTGIGAGKLDTEVLKSLSVRIPSKNERKILVRTFKNLQDKIELNRKMNQTLEAMAQTLFQSWFVDFDPVLDNAIAEGNTIPEELKAKAAKRSLVPEDKKLRTVQPELAELFPNRFVYNEELEKWIPEGWDIGKLDEIVEVKYGKDHKKLNEGKYPCYGSGGIMRYVDSTLCDSESVLIPRKGTLSNLMLVREPFWSVDTMFFTTFKKDNYAKFVFYFLQKFNFEEMNVGSAVPSMTTAVLNNIDLLQPTDSVLHFFELEAERLLLKKEKNILQTQSLTQLRDTLLPQLISGKLKVPEALLKVEQAVE